MKNIEQEIQDLEKQLKEKRAEAERLKELERKRKEQEIINNTAADLIEQGINFLLDGLELIFKPEDVDFLEEFLLNPDIVPFCANIIALKDDPIFKLIFSVEEKNNNTKKEKTPTNAVNNAIDAINAFANALDKFAE